MKTSVAISWQDTDFGAVAKGNATDLISQARSAGYDAVELAVRDPRIIAVEEIRAALGGMPVSAIGTGQAFLADGLSLSHENAEVRDAAVERLMSHCSLAASVGCPIVIIGLIRGISGDAGNLIMSLRQICEFADGIGIRLVIEPINRYETNLINRASQGIEIIMQSGVRNLGLLLDTFHMNIEEANPVASIVSSRRWLWHVHVADSNRQAPGSGHVDFREIIGLLHALDYNGYVSAEVAPYPDAPTAMDTALETMHKCMAVALSTKGERIEHERTNATC